MLSYTWLASNFGRAPYELRERIHDLLGATRHAPQPALQTQGHERSSGIGHRSS
jgi:hypothetical protein